MPKARTDWDSRIGRRLTLRDLHILSSVARWGSMAKAATHLSTTQSVVSDAIANLETALGVRLLQRTTHALQLTEAGQRCFDRAKGMLAAWHGLAEDVREGDDAPEGVLRVIAPHAFGQHQLIAPVVDYLRRYANVTIEWRLHDGPVRMIEDGIDCIIRVGAVREESVVARKLFEVERIVVAAPQLVEALSATRPAQLAHLPWLAFGTYYRNAIKLHDDRGRTATLKLRPRLVTDSLFALRSACIAGLGVAVASSWVVQDELASGRLVHLLPRWRAAAMPLYIVYPQARFYPAKLRRFVEAMRTVVAP